MTPERLDELAQLWQIELTVEFANTSAAACLLKHQDVADTLAALRAYQRDLATIERTGALLLRRETLPAVADLQTGLETRAFDLLSDYLHAKVEIAMWEDSFNKLKARATAPTEAQDPPLPPRK